MLHSAIKLTGFQRLVSIKTFTVLGGREQSARERSLRDDLCQGKRIELLLDLTDWKDSLAKSALWTVAVSAEIQMRIQTDSAS